MNARRVLIGAPLMPAFDQESGSRRIFDLIILLQEAGWSVNFVAENGRGGERYAHLLQQRGIAVYSRIDEKLERLFARGRLDLAIFAFWHLAEALMPMVRRLSPSTRVVVDSIDLHFVRNARRLFQALRANQAGAGLEAATGLDARFGSEIIRELNIYAAADGVLTVSQKEADLVGDMTDDPTLPHVVPDCEELPRSTISNAERKGITFIGNFRHPPNVSAAEFLCQEIVPRMNADLLAQHPVYIVGNALDDRIRTFAGNHPCIRIVGWVPSVIPYLERTRVSVVPLLYGAGTKRKMLQALMVGTPTVSTRAGVEGLGLEQGEHVMVADDPGNFAASIERLLIDTSLWERLAHRGRDHIIARHGREVVRKRLLEVVSTILSKAVKRSLPQGAAYKSAVMGPQPYREMVERVCRTIEEAVPAGETVAIATRGDAELLKVSGRLGWHFPQDSRGGYAGHYPRDGMGAIEQLEILRTKGAGFVVFPDTSRWWLDYYDELQQHLVNFYRRVLEREGTCTIFDVRTAKQNSPIDTASILGASASAST